MLTQNHYLTITCFIAAMVDAGDLEWALQLLDEFGMFEFARATEQLW
jgi:pentatricopeptide repeat protein